MKLISLVAVLAAVTVVPMPPAQAPGRAAGTGGHL
jgi:hypothetical protein